MALHSFRSFAYCRSTSTVIHPLPKATFTPSIQPYLGLKCTRPPLTSAINTLLAIQYSSILSTCPHHLNTLWSALLTYSLSIPALLRTSSFLTLFIRGTPTKLLKHFISRTFNFLPQHFSYTPSLCSVQRRCQEAHHILILTIIIYNRFGCCSNDWEYGLPKLTRQPCTDYGS